MDLIYYPELESTNITALEELKKRGSPGYVIWAGRQVAGQGQYGRRFHSPEGGLYFTLVIDPQLNETDLPLLPVTVGLGCATCLESTSTVSLLLKWPNDLIVRGRKLAGILVRNVPGNGSGQRVALIGVGINVQTRPHDFPVELAPSVISLSELSPRVPDKKTLLTDLIHSISEWIELLRRNREKVVAAWNERDYCKGRTVRHTGSERTFIGIGRGMHDDGTYLIQTSDGEVVSVLSGSLRIISTQE